MSRHNKELREADIISLREAGRLVMSRPRLLNGTVCAAGDAPPSGITSRLLLRLYEGGNIAVTDPPPAKDNPIMKALRMAFHTPEEEPPDEPLEEPLEAKTQPRTAGPHVKHQRGKAG